MEKQKEIEKANAKKKADDDIKNGHVTHIPTDESKDENGNLDPQNPDRVGGKSEDKQNGPVPRS